MTIDQLLAEVEPVAWRYRHPKYDHVFWQYIHAPWPELWVENSFIREPLFSAEQMAAEREAREKAEAERDRLERNRDMWRDQCDRQSKALDEMRRAALVRIKEAKAVIAPFASFDTEDFPDSMRLFEDDPNLSMGHLRAAAKFMEAKDGNQ